MENTKAEKEIFAKGYNGYKLFWIFLLSSFIGDVTETIFCRLKFGYWSSRSSVIYGPFSLVWGIGAVLLTVCLRRPSDRRDLSVFLSGALLGGGYEYVCSLIQEVLFGARFWDYSKLPFNLNGRINLLYCLFWGLLALVWVKDIYPGLSRRIEKIPRKIGISLTWILLAFMVWNSAISAGAILRMGDRLQGLPPKNHVEVYLDAHFPNEKIGEVYPSMKLLR